MLRSVTLVLVFFSLNSTMASAQTQWLRDDSLKVGFAYDDATWKRVNPAESATKFAVNRTLKEGGFLATCYLQEYPSQFARGIESDVPGNKDRITNSVMANTRKRFPDATLLSSKETSVDQIPAILIERQVHGENLGKAYSMTVITLFAAWKETEIYLECGYDDTLHKVPTAETKIRGEIIHTLGTLHFER